MSTPNSATILVVEDEASVRDLLQELLTPDGYNILLAADGMEAMDLILRSKPDLILLDILMPRLDGIGFCQQLRLDPVAQKIPVIVVTAFGSRDHLEEAMAAGADDFVAKPFDVTELKIRIRTMLRLKHITDEVERLQQYIVTVGKELAGKKE